MQGRRPSAPAHRCGMHSVSSNKTFRSQHTTRPPRRRQLVFDCRKGLLPEGRYAVLTGIILPEGPKPTKSCEGALHRLFDRQVKHLYFPRWFPIAWAKPKHEQAYRIRRAAPYETETAMRGTHGRYANLSTRLIKRQRKEVFAPQRRTEGQLSQRAGFEKQVEAEHTEQQHEHRRRHDDDRAAGVRPHC